MNRLFFSMGSSLIYLDLVSILAIAESFESSSSSSQELLSEEAELCFDLGFSISESKRVLLESLFNCLELGFRGKKPFAGLFAWARIAVSGWHGGFLFTGTGILMLGLISVWDETPIFDCFSSEDYMESVLSVCSVAVGCWARFCRRSWMRSCWEIRIVCCWFIR